jgi:hypothetical protein
MHAIFSIRQSAIQNLYGSESKYRKHILSQIEVSKIVSSNYPIRSRQNIGRNYQPYLLGGFQIDHEFEFSRLLDSGLLLRLCITGQNESKQ